MEKYSYIDEIDEMLKWFYKRSISDESHIDYTNFKSLYKVKNQSIEAITLRNECLIKLINDGYITKLDLKINFEGNPEIKNEDGFRISFEGLVFYELGGYRAKIKRETILASLQSAQTWAISVGTVLAALGTIGLLIFEFYHSSCR